MLNTMGKIWKRGAWVALTLLVLTGIFSRFHHHERVQEENTHSCTFCLLSAQLSSDLSSVQKVSVGFVPQFSQSLFESQATIPWIIETACSIRGPPSV